ncbi:MAG: PaaI family thioesterase [Pseudomonadota bacterium]
MTLARDQLQELLDTHFPDSGIVVDEAGDGTARIHQSAGPGHLRPGGTVLGPVQMALADTAVYLALMSTAGGLFRAVTSSLHISFLRRPAPGSISASARLIKLGSRLAVGDVLLYSDDAPEPVAQATVTYSLPPADATGDNPDARGGPVHLPTDSS